MGTFLFNSSHTRISPTVDGLVLNSVLRYKMPRAPFLCRNTDTVDDIHNRFRCISIGMSLKNDKHISGKMVAKVDIV